MHRAGIAGLGELAGTCFLLPALMTSDTLASRRLGVRHSLARAPQQLFGFVVYAIHAATLRAQGEDRLAAKSSKIANDLRNLTLLIWSGRQGISHAVLHSCALLGVRNFVSLNRSGQPTLRGSLVYVLTPLVRRGRTLGSAA